MNGLRNIFFKIVEKTNFLKINFTFQNKLNSGIKDIKSSRKKLTQANKTFNFYKIFKEKYGHLLHNSMTKTYKRKDPNTTKAFNDQVNKTTYKTDLTESSERHRKIKH